MVNGRKGRAILWAPKRDMDAPPQFPNRADRLPKPLGKTPRVGRIQRAVRRGFIASQGEPLSTSQLVARAFRGVCDLAVRTGESGRREMVRARWNGERPQGQDDFMGAKSCGPNK